MNGVDFPVATSPRRDRRRAGGRVRPDQGEHGRPARAERGFGRPDGPLGAGGGPHPPLHRVHGRGALERLAPRRGRAGRARWSRRSRPRCPSSRSRRTTRARSPTAGATPTGPARSGSSPRSPSRSAGPAPGPGSRPTASSTPASSRSKGTDLREPLRGGRDRRRAGRRDPGRLVGPGRPLLGAPLGGDGRPAPGRDVRDGRLTAGPPRLSTGRPQVGRIAWTGRRPMSAKFVDKRVDRVPAADYRGRARRGRPGTGTLAITSRVSLLEPVASGASLPGARDLTVARDGRPAGRDRHPGVGTPTGRARSPEP